MQDGKQIKLSLEKIISLFLGCLWLLDGLLQLQPQMFTQAFIDTILSPNLQGQPGVIAHILTFGANLFKMHMILGNLFFASVQIFLGILLLLPLPLKWKRLSLWISIPWALIVWIFGEGLGNLFTGSASVYTGAPGSVLLYLMLALFLLFPKKLLLSYLPRVVGLVFLFGALLQLLPMFWTNAMQTMLFQMSLGDKMKPIALPAKYIASVATGTIPTNGIAIGMLVILGLLLLLKPQRIIGYATLIFLFFVWWISQDFGGIFTFPFGTATDPNSAPLLALFLLPIFFQNNKKEIAIYLPRFSKHMKSLKKKDYTRWIIMFLIVIIVVLVSILFTILTPTQSSSQGSGVNDMDMTLKTFAVPASKPKPTVSLVIKKEPDMNEWDAHILTTNFTFEPNKLGEKPILGEGHVHLFVDGKLYVVLGPWFHIDALPKGKHTVLVRLANNDHSTYAVNGNYIQVIQALEVH